MYIHIYIYVYIHLHICTYTGLTVPSACGRRPVTSIINFGAFLIHKRIYYVESCHRRPTNSCTCSYVHHVCMCARVNICVYVCMNVGMYICMYVCICCLCVCVCACMYVCMHAYMYVCMYVYLFRYTHFSLSKASPIRTYHRRLTHSCVCVCVCVCVCMRLVLCATEK